MCVTVNAEESAEEVLKKIKADAKVIELLEKNEVVKEIYVPCKIYNIVVKNK